MIRIFCFVLLLCSSNVLLSQNAAELETLKSFNYQKNVVYKTVDGQNIDLDIFYPNSTILKKNNPWMVHVHGGGWAGGSKYNILKKAYLGSLKTLLDSGVICVSIEYRRARGTTTAYAAVVDAKDATRFLLKNAEKYKLDTERYGVWGGSAGGHLSLLTALGNDADYIGDAALAAIPTKFKCVASYFPFTSCVNPEIRPGSIFEDGTLFERLLGAPLSEKPELALLLSPSEQLKASSPPILLIHGDKDSVLPISNSLYLMEVAKKKNANIELLTIKNAEHSFNGSNISPSITELNTYSTKFMLSHLK